LLYTSVVKAEQQTARIIENATDGWQTSDSCRQETNEETTKNTGGTEPSIQEDARSGRGEGARASIERETEVGAERKQRKESADTAITN
jgi:hypothetical protein